MPKTKTPIDKKLPNFGEEQIFQWLEDGKYLSHLAKKLKCSHGDLYRWLAEGELGRDGKTARQRRWNEAKQIRAAVLLEEARELLETAKPESSAESNLIKTRVNHLQFEAAKLSPDEFGDKQPQQQINLDIGSLHLDALRQYGKLTPSDWEEPAALPAPVEVLEGGADANG